MSDQPNPETPEAAETVETVTVRRSPRYGVFLVLGGGLGVFAAMILTFAFDGSDEPAANGVIYSDGQVFGFLALVCVAIGLFVGGAVAVLLDWTVGRRTRRYTADHASVHAPE